MKTMEIEIVDQFDEKIKKIVDDINKESDTHFILVSQLIEQSKNVFATSMNFTISIYHLEKLAEALKKLKN